MYVIEYEVPVVRQYCDGEGFAMIPTSSRLKATTDKDAKLKARTVLRRAIRVCRGRKVEPRPLRIIKVVKKW